MVELDEDTAGYSEMPSIGDEAIQTIYSLTKDQTAVLLLRYLGYKPKEIIRILEYKSTAKYYLVLDSIKLHLTKEKIGESGYN